MEAHAAYMSTPHIERRASAGAGQFGNQIKPMELAALYRMLDLLFPLEPLLELEPEPVPPPLPEPDPVPDPPELAADVLAVPTEAAVAPLFP